MITGLRRRRWRHAAAGGAVVSACYLVISGCVLHGTSARPVAPPATSESTGEPAKGCSADPDPVVTVTINPDGPMPTDSCAIVGKNQRLRVVNATNAFNQPGATITLTFADLPPRTLHTGQATTYDVPFGTYLAPGQHWLHVSSYGDSIIVIWLR
jgi:hypothetical protein